MAAWFWNEEIFSDLRDASLNKAEGNIRSESSVMFQKSVLLTEIVKEYLMLSFDTR